jgi:ABC-type transport system involved in multi-copper enzyme maturation permease subunit
MSIELLKLRTTRATRTLLIWMVALVLLLVLMHVLGPSAEVIETRDNQFRIIGWGTGIAALFAALLGAISVTAEFRHGTIRPTFLAAPERTRVILAKAAAAALAGAALGLLAQALTIAVDAAALSARGIDNQLTAGDLAQLVTGGAVAGALWAVIGVGLGALVRNQVSAVTALCVWLLLIETVVIGIFPDAGRLTPGAAAGALAGALQTATPDDLPAPAGGLALLLVYAVIAATAGVIATERRDVE